MELPRKTGVTCIPTRHKFARVETQFKPVQSHSGSHFLGHLLLALPASGDCSRKADSVSVFTAAGG